MITMPSCHVIEIYTTSLELHRCQCTQRLGFKTPWVSLVLHKAALMTHFLYTELHVFLNVTDHKHKPAF